jgi:hypothetical protein
MRPVPHTQLIISMSAVWVYLHARNGLPRNGAPLHTALLRRLKYRRPLVSQTDRLGRTLARLGLRRVPKVVETPSLNEYLAETYGNREEDGPDEAVTAEDADGGPCTYRWH